MAHKLILRKDYSGHFCITVELNPLSQPHFYIIFLRSKAQPAFHRFFGRISVVEPYHEVAECSGNESRHWNHHSYSPI